jgi:hypothetical protein
VKKVTTSNESICMQQCADDYHCSKWTFHSDLENGCYLESELLSDIKELFLVNETFTSKKVTKMYRDTRNKYMNMDHVSIQHLLSQSVATDSRTKLNFPQYFVKGCSYTITLWVWLWKNERHERKNKRESILFSTRQMNPKNNKNDEVLLPAIIFDIMKFPGRFFFSATKDSAGDYSGFSPPQNIRFHEWTHIAMTIKEEYVSAYINGKFQQIAKMAPSTSEVRKCPHTSSIRGSNFVSENNENVYGNNEENQEEIISNTIFQVAGGKHIPSIPGMVQDVMIFGNVALSESHIQQVMRSNKPIISKTLKSLMNLYGLYSLEGYSVKQWEDDYFLMNEWGICPVAVCGPVCFDEKFLLGHVNNESNRSRGSGSYGVRAKSQKNKAGKDVDLMQLVDEYFGIDPSNPPNDSEEKDLYEEDMYVDASGYGYGYGDYSSEENDEFLATGITDYGHDIQYDRYANSDIDTNLDFDPHGSFGSAMDRNQRGEAGKKKSGLKSNRMVKMNEKNKMTAPSINKDTSHVNEQSFGSGIVTDNVNFDEISDEINYDDRVQTNGIVRPFYNHSTAEFYLPRRYSYSYNLYKRKVKENFIKDGNNYQTDISNTTLFSTLFSGTGPTLTSLYTYISSSTLLFMYNSVFSFFFDQKVSMENISETDANGNKKTERVETQTNRDNVYNNNNNDIKIKAVIKERNKNNRDLNKLDKAEKDFMLNHPTGK